MEIREFAQRILLSAEVAVKLQPIAEQLTDAAPGPATRVEVPVRPPELVFAPRRTAPQMPPNGRLHEPAQRGIAHHIMANHELQALEVMAWTLLAFPEAPAEFRSGLCNVMRDEQRHTRMHAERASHLGVPFGSLPVNCYIWKKALSFTSVMDYLAGLPLVFEGANLDHSFELAAVFRTAGDERSARIMQAIHEDEIQHVRFGLEWLRKLKPAKQTDWEAFTSHLHWPLRAAKARGDDFQRAAREAAGMTDEFIQQLLQAPLQPNDPPPRKESP